MKTSIGICIGATTVSVVRVAEEKASAGPEALGAEVPVRVILTALLPHEGAPRKTLCKALEAMNLAGTERIAATGRKFRHFINLPGLSEPEAVEMAYARIKPQGTDCPAIISAGGETFMVYKLDRGGQITNVYTGNKCAAGTGEFFQQQLRRLGASLEEAAQWAAETEPYGVSGRCSVFCKSDCTHATNKGIPKARVAAGLGRMMANKVLELLKRVDRRNLMLTGGTCHNQMMVAYLKKALPGLIIPDQAPYFEAFGAALWALKQPEITVPEAESLFLENRNSFGRLPALTDSASQVTFKTMAQDAVRSGDTCILGLDVGSTTTKAVLIRRQDHALLASVYLRTNGDPVGASCKCYRAIADQVRGRALGEPIQIVGLGVCGSGRQIAGLHAMTRGVFNEITAHATAAVYFDPGVDTIFEIGGQDAKYTYITNGVPSDYAMNEACSAGTGSFLEESAWETMGIPMEQIADAALKAPSSPNFNDQCAAFIASDIKNAIHDGLGHEEIVAGLVYSICMNYSNRVKGNRPVGHKVFMQGGVCYNRAVPLAMAALTGKDIIVPPEPGLMGAFGAALEVHKRLNAGLLKEDRFSLEELADRQVTYGRSFVCKGGKEKCDRGCEIARIIIDGQTFPFGGACNRYDNLRKGARVNSDALNMVRIRQELIFGKYAPAPRRPAEPGWRGRVGLNRSFLVNTYYPLYANFFSALGFDPVLPRHPDPRGIDQRNAPFCFPGELAHGFFHDLITMDDPPDYIFLPHFKSIPTVNGERFAQVCPLVQGETFYLQATFREQLKTLQARGVRVLSPMLDLTRGLQAAGAPLIAMARTMGVKESRAVRAFDTAVATMEACLAEMARLGRQAMDRLEQDPRKIGIVLLARPYNGYVSEAHMGIPDKFASRGILVLPLDFLDYTDQSTTPSMYWGMGQRIMMATKKIKSHAQLFGTFITNFSCGPDSFIIGFFRELLGSKPSLTLELDSHSADAGLETRIEAFLDILGAYRQKALPAAPAAPAGGFCPARIKPLHGQLGVGTSEGLELPLTDPRVTFLFPSMGDLSTKALAAAFRGVGFNARPLAPADEAILKLGRGHTSCKECLPLILTTGLLMDYIRKRPPGGEITVYFMPDGSGPCRFGQYHIFMEDLIQKLRIPDVAIFSLSSDLGYEGVPGRVHRRGWWAVVISDVFEDIRAMLMTNARQPEQALEIFERQYRHVLAGLETGDFQLVQKALRQATAQLGRIALKRPPQLVPVITLAGEIYVRRDGLSRQYLTEYLAARGFATACAPVAEWIHYSDYVINKGWSDHTHEGLHRKLGARIKQHVMRKDERRIKKILSGSGLVHAMPIRIAEVIDTARPYISPYLSGEAILTVGSALKEVVSESCGAIAIGPFGCMPNRLSEAILTESMKREDKLACAPGDRRLRAVLSGVNDLPFLAIESDGSPFPQQILAKLEAFCLRAERLHRRMIRCKGL
jgi:predicted CoA-substrate-specific enzyme activase